MERTARKGFGETMLPYLRPRPIAALLLGISSGFPLALLLGTMTFWLARVGIDKKTIGFAIGLTTPYTLKFLWAPLIDRLRLPLLTPALGQRRAWLFLVQALLFAAVWMLGASDPARHIGVFAFWAIVVAFLGATQDIVIDAYRIEILPDDELPHGTANNQFGYRLGNFIAGVGYDRDGLERRARARVGECLWPDAPSASFPGWSLPCGPEGACTMPPSRSRHDGEPGCRTRSSARSASSSRGGARC